MLKSVTNIHNSPVIHVIVIDLICLAICCTYFYIVHCYHGKHHCILSVCSLLLLFSKIMSISPLLHHPLCLRPAVQVEILDSLWEVQHKETCINMSQYWLWLLLFINNLLKAASWWLGTVLTSYRIVFILPHLVGYEATAVTLGEKLMRKRR